MQVVQFAERSAVATLRDVANAVGVSESTVSRALQRPETVATNTLSQIRLKAAELGYRPRGSAEAPQRTAQAIIAVLVPDLVDPYFASSVKAVQERATYRNYRMIIVDSNYDRAKERDFLTSIDHDVSGVILISPRSSKEVIEKLQPKVPIVIALQEHTVLPAIVLDESYHVERIMTHLKALGHSKVVYVAGPAHSEPNKRRYKALQAYTSRKGEAEVTMLGNVSPLPAGGYSIADELIASGFTAAIAFNDMVAMGLVSRLIERGVRVPEDVNVIGFDDLFIAAMMQPPLSTIQLPITEVGNAAVDLLDEWIATKVMPVSPPPLHGELIVRRSTGPISQDDQGVFA